MESAAGLADVRVVQEPVNCGGGKCFGHELVDPVPDGAQTTRFSRRLIHSRVRMACWVGAGIEETAGSQASKVFPVGKPAALRRVASMDRARPAASSVNKGLDDLDRFPALGAGGRDQVRGQGTGVGHFQLPHQGFQFGRQGRGAVVFAVLTGLIGSASSQLRV
jgi:hypothetical protein